MFNSCLLEQYNQTVLHLAQASGCTYISPDRKFELGYKHNPEMEDQLTYNTFIEVHS